MAGMTGKRILGQLKRPIAQIGNNRMSGSDSIEDLPFGYFVIEGEGFRDIVTSISLISKRYQ
jgi:hypothetical protein